MKPDTAIYELAINRFNLIPNQTIFIDDAITFWVDYNSLYNQIIDTLMYTNNNLSSIKYTYFSDDIHAQFVHIKVDGGYHDWFESENGNWGFDSHEQIYSFFHQFLPG